MGSELKFLGIIIFVFMINAYYTFATWLNPPTQHLSNKKLNCIEWILAYDFSENNTEHNRTEAQVRNRKYDIDVVETAALYAQFLCSFHSNERFLPSEFCAKYDFCGYSKFQNLTKTTIICQDWLKIYGFEDLREIGNNGNIIEPETQHWNRSKNRNKSEDKYISIWPALFVRFLDDVPEEKSIRTPDFCKGLGQEKNKYGFPFMTIETKMCCEEWIEFVGYSSDMEKNLEVFEQMKMFDKYINTWAQLYGDHLYVDSKYVPMGRQRGNFPDLDIYQYTLHVFLNSFWLKPYEFCLHKEGDDSYPRPLYTYHHDDQT